LACPALFTYGGKELTHGGIAFAGLPDILLGLSPAERWQVSVIDGADHMYTGVGPLLAETMSRWLAAQAPAIT
jgi:hypothetical protein